MTTTIPDNELIKMFQRYLSTNDSSEIDKLRSEDLAAAEARMGLKFVNANFREVIRNKSRELGEREARQHESKIRAWGYVMTLIVGLVTGGISTWLFVN